MLWDFIKASRRFWPWCVRALIAFILLNGLAPAPPRTSLQAPQTPQTANPFVCIHTRLIDEVDDWKIQRSLELVREIGASTIVEFFPWAYVESAEDRYDWTRIDRILRHARNQGLRVVARLGLVPHWARGDVEDNYTTLNYLPEGSYADFVEFVVDFAGRYAEAVDHIIIWNEPNLAFEWGYRDVDPAGYVQLLRAVYGPAHAANPNVVILAAPLAPTLEPPGSQNGLNDLLYLEELYEAGGAGYFDALAMHTYGFTDPPEAAPGPDLLNFRRAELSREIMVRYGDQDKPVFITESGWNDHPRWTKAVRPSQRIAYTLNAYQWTEEHWPWVEALCTWALRYPVATQSYPDNFTLVTPDFQLKPIYYALQAYARGWQSDEALWLSAPGE